MADAIERVSLATTISARNSSLTTDSLLNNCYPEQEENQDMDVVRRFGQTFVQQYTAGQALGLFTYQNQILAVVGTTAYLGVTSLGTVDGTSPYQFTLTTSNNGFVLKNNAKAYYYNGSTLAQITDSNYPTTTVAGVATLDNSQYYLTSAGSIWNCNTGTPTVFNALNFLSAGPTPSPGVAITSYLNYVVAFTANTCAFFTDNANAIGSPLIINSSATLSIGCASAASVVQTKNTIIWVGQTKQRGRSIYVLNGLVAEAISNTYIDRALAKDDLVNVYAYFIEINGHYLYVLTLKDSNLTLVYDMQTNEWHTWSSSILSTPLAITQAVLNQGVVTLTIPNHGISNGTVVQILGVAPVFYTGNFIVNVLDQNNIFYSTTSSLVGGINSEAINAYAVNQDQPVQLSVKSLTATPWSQNYFRGAYYTYANNTDYLLQETSGTLLQIAEGLSNDNGTFIYMTIQTDTNDFGSNEVKFSPAMEIVGDKSPGAVYIGYSDNDYQSFGYFRVVNMNANRAMVRRCGSFRRRAWQIVYIGQYPSRFYSLDVYLNKGTM